MANIILTSTTGSGFLETDFDQIKLLINGEDTLDLGLNTTHRGSDGSDHSFINQAVTTTSNPVFNSVAVGSGEKVFFEGASSDTYITYNSSASKLEVWVNGVKKADWG